MLLFALVRAGDAATLARLLDMGLVPNLRDGKGDSLLMLAAYHGHVDAVRVLLEHGADASLANDRGQTPLAGAVFKGDTEVVQALLAGGANPAAGTPSAVDTARMFGRAEVLELFGAA